MSPTSPILYAARDERIVEGRAERSGETYYVVPGCALSSVSATVLGADSDFYTGWVAAMPVVVDQLAFEITSLLAGNTRVGFYRADRDWQPIGAPLADSGDISTGTTGVKTYTPSTPILVRPGRYVSVVNGSAAPTYRRFIGGPAVGIDSAMGAVFLGAGEVGRAHAAFPTPGTAWTTQSLTGNVWSHFVVYRLSSP